MEQKLESLFFGVGYFFRRQRKKLLLNTAIFQFILGIVYLEVISRNHIAYYDAVANRYFPLYICASFVGMYFVWASYSKFFFESSAVPYKVNFVFNFGDDGRVISMLHAMLPCVAFCVATGLIPALLAVSTISVLFSIILFLLFYALGLIMVYASKEKLEEWLVSMREKKHRGIQLYL